jgi:hypothetical protein
MKNEIPPIRTSAPIAIAATLPPPRLLPLVDVVVGVTTVGVVAVGVGAGELGRPGENGLCVPVPGWAAAPAGTPRAVATVAAMRTARTRTAEA